VRVHPVVEVPGYPQAKRGRRRDGYPHQGNGCVLHFGYCHIYNVEFAQIDFSRAACALDHNHFVFGRQFLDRFPDRSDWYWWYSRAGMWLTGFPRTTTCVVSAAPDSFLRFALFHKRLLEKPISPPLLVRWELFDMFCALKGATR
jgi:hypothetical protein